MTATVPREPADLPRDLGAGATLRAATPADVEAIMALSIEAHGAVVESGIEWVMDDPAVGPEAWTVVTSDGEVVSTCTLLDLQLRIGDRDVRTGAIEYVATAAAYRGRGFVQAQIAVQHARSESRGDLIQMIVGIPYFYRRFGYGYGASHPDRYRVTRVPAPIEDILIRTAVAADRFPMETLHARANGGADVALVWTDRDWDAVVSGRPAWGDHVIVATRGPDATVVGWARFETDPEIGSHVIQAAARDDEAARALLAHLADRLDDQRWWVLGRPGDPWDDVVRAHARPEPGFNALYVRIPDPIALLEHLRPLLDARLAASPHAISSGEVVISRSVDSVRMRYADGHIIDIQPGPVSIDPWEDGHVGVPPDWFPALVLGRFTPSELEARVDDVTLDPHRELIETLFPRCQADLVGPL